MTSYGFFSHITLTLQKEKTPKSTTLFNGTNIFYKLQKLYNTSVKLV